MKGLLTLLCLFFSVPLIADTKILAFSGSTREGSYNYLLVQEAARIARELGAQVTVIDLKEYPIPIYNEDLERMQGMPNSAKRIRQLMIGSDAIIIASPEYNSTLAPLLSNVLHWASRSEDGKSSREAFKGKKFALMSASPSKSGGSRALPHLRSLVEDVGGQVVSKQVSVPSAYQAFNDKGQLLDEALKQELRAEIQQLIPPPKTTQ